MRRIFIFLAFLACLWLAFLPESNVRPAPMPVPGVRTSFNFAAPAEQRDARYRRWLAPSLRVNLSGSAGSGTIVYYDAGKNLAYVASCGHLWKGNMSAAEGRTMKLAGKVTAWYHNGQKLISPREYAADVIFYSNTRGFDTSLLTFTPDWVPYFFPIAPVEYPVSAGMRLHSCGCDGAREVAHYDVEVIGMNRGDLTTKYNSPRPGRSGGGLMDDKFYVGTCWGTERTDGSGIGFFTPLSAIHSYWGKQAGYEWLLRVKGGGLGQEVPVNNRIGGPNIHFPRDYILMP